MSTPLTNKSTFSSRMKMNSALTSVKPINNNNNYNGHQKPTQAVTNGAASRLPPRTTIKQPISSQLTRNEQTLATNSCRIPPPRSRLPSAANQPQQQQQPSSSRLDDLVDPTSVSLQRANPPTFSRSTSKMSAISSIGGPRASNCNYSIASTKMNSNFASRQNSLASSTSVHAATVRKPTIASIKSTYIPDTNTVRKGLAKFQNPIECQRQFQALNSEIRQLNEIISNKDKQISQLQEQLEITQKQGVGYATVVQYFAKKLKIDTDELDLETECEQLKVRVAVLLQGEKEFETRLEACLEDYKSRIQMQQDLTENIRRELEETKEQHFIEVDSLKKTHTDFIDDLTNQHSNLKQELESRILYLETELNSKTKELTEIRIEHDILNNNYNKLEESLTKDKDARVKYVQDKANQLQKEVDSLNSVLEMRTERMHVLEKEMILFDEAKQELAMIKDLSKTQNQQIESLTVALENRKENFEILLADKEKLELELKRERKERRRMTMRTEQLEYALNDSIVNEHHVPLAEQEEKSRVEILECGTR